MTRKGHVPFYAKGSRTRRQRYLAGKRRRRMPQEARAEVKDSAAVVEAAGRGRRRMPVGSCRTVKACEQTPQSQ